MLYNITMKDWIKQLANDIAKKHNPERIILFGSYAWGTPHKDSDVDLYIVKDTRDTRAYAREIDKSVFPRKFPLDIIVHTPNMVNDRINIKDMFVKDILDKGEVLYDSTAR